MTCSLSCSLHPNIVWVVSNTCVSDRRSENVDTQEFVHACPSKHYSRYPKGDGKTVPCPSDGQPNIPYPHQGGSEVIKEGVPTHGATGGPWSHCVQGQGPSSKQWRPCVTSSFHKERPGWTTPGPQVVACPLPGRLGGLSGWSLPVATGASFR